MAQDYPTIPTGENLYTAPGPGATVANTLQAILAQRRNEERQAMIDALNSKNVESEIKTREDNAATNATYRKAQADASAQNADDKKAKRARLDNISGYYSGQWSDDPIVQHAYEYGSVNPEDSDRIETVIASRLLANEGKPKMVPGYAFDDATHKTIPLTKPAHPPLVGDEPLMVPDNQPIHHITRSAEQGATGGHDSGTFAGPAQDANGKVIPGEFFVIRNGRLEKQKPVGAENNFLGAKPTDTVPKPIITPAEAENYAKARGKATDNASAGWGSPGKKATDQDKAVFAQLDATIKSRFKPNIVAAAEEMARVQRTVDPNSQVSTEALVEAAVAQGFVPEQEKSELYQLLKVIR